MVFRRDNKGDAFQRQINALRQQLGSDAEPEIEIEPEEAEAVAPEMVERRPSRDERPAGFRSRDANFSFGEFGSSSPVERTALPPDDGHTVALPVARSDAQASVIAHDMVWKGDLETGGSIHIHGRVEGSITAEREVFVAEEATVDATISALNVVVAGSFNGLARCGGRFEVLPQGRVKGDVQAPTLVVHEGGIVAGRVQMGSPETKEPAQPESIAQRWASRGR